MKRQYNHPKWIKSGALAGVTFSIFSLLVSDLHTISDFLIARLQEDTFLSALPKGLEFPFLFTGYIASPILAVSLIFVGLGILAIYKRNRDKIALVSAILVFLSAASSVFSGFADVRYALAVGSLNTAVDLNMLVNAGWMRGISALIMGVIAGLALPIFLYSFFHRKGNRLGKAGAAITLLSVLFGIALKTLSLMVLPTLMMMLFLVLMGIKSVGFILISAALFVQTASSPDLEII